MTQPAQTPVYDVVGENHGRWAQIPTTLETAEQARAVVANSRRTSTSITWHMIARTTTITEQIAGHVLDDAHRAASDHGEPHQRTTAPS